VYIYIYPSVVICAVWFYLICLLLLTAAWLLTFTSDPPDKLTFDCQKIAKKLPMAIFFEKNENFGQLFFEKMSSFGQVLGNFLTFKWQFSGGSASKLYLKLTVKEVPNLSSLVVSGLNSCPLHHSLLMFMRIGLIFFID